MRSAQNGEALRGATCYVARGEKRNDKADRSHASDRGDIIRRDSAGATNIPDANGAVDRAVRSRERHRRHGAAVRGSAYRTLGQTGRGRNRPGGDGLVAIKAFVDARDDHTFFFGPAGAFLVHLYDQDRPPYDTDDIVPIVGIYVTVLAISVPASLNINTIDHLVELARSQPGKLNAAAATGNSDFLIFGFIKEMGLQITRVPYRDIMQAPNDLAENRIQVLSTSLAAAQPLMQAGRIKVLVVTSKERATHRTSRPRPRPAIRR